MTERLKYSLNGVYRCENFAQHLANDDFPSVEIGSAGGFTYWLIKLRSDSAGVIYPWVYPNVPEVKHGIRCFFCVLKKDGSRSYIGRSSLCLEMNWGACGWDMDILELLNVKNGYLNDGALMIEYGIQVESFLRKDNIWRFTKSNPLFDCQEKSNMITFPRSVNHSFHAHKQLLSFHSSYFNERCKKDKGNLVERNDLFDKHGLFEALDSFIQIVNGVRLKFSEYHIWSVYEVMNVAEIYSTTNVIHYCERQLIEEGWNLGNKKDWVIHWDGLRHYLVHLLRNVKSPREMIDETDIGKMKGETMKIFIAKFLYNKF